MDKWSAKTQTTEISNTGDLKVMENERWKPSEFLTSMSLDGSKKLLVAFRRYINAEGEEVIITFQPGKAYVWGNMILDNKNPVVDRIWSIPQQLQYVRMSNNKEGYPDKFTGNTYMINDASGTRTNAVKELKLRESDIKDIVSRCNELAEQFA